MSDFKVGDKVLCSVFGLGVVTMTDNESHDFPIVVKFSNSSVDDFYSDVYTETGKLYVGSSDEGEHIRLLTPLEQELL